jgi:multidrug efflux pump subunit AcrA (membrane-fusion protein)
LGLLKVKAHVLEQDAGTLQVGQDAEISVDAFPGEVIKGKLERIDTLARPLMRPEFRSRGFFTRYYARSYESVKFFEVELSVTDEVDPVRLKPGMPVTVSIFAARIPDAIAVPRYSIFQENGKEFVYLLTGEAPMRKFVKVGVRSRARVVVTEGLAPGDRIAMRNPFLTYAEFAGAQEAGEEDKAGRGGS